MLTILLTVAGWLTLYGLARYVLLGRCQDCRRSCSPWNAYCWRHRAEFPAAPAAPGGPVPGAVADRPVEDRIADLNAQIAQARREGRHDRADRLLDMRNTIRAPRPPAEVPVIPGRTS